MWQKRTEGEVYSSILALASSGVNVTRTAANGIDRTRRGRDSPAEEIIPLHGEFH